jgi:hypothetical protein
MMVCYLIIERKLLGGVQAAAAALLLALVGGTRLAPRRLRCSRLPSWSSPSWA